MDLVIDPVLQQNVTGVFGEAGRIWLHNIGTVIDKYRDAWSLKVFNPEHKLSFNIILPALCDDGREAILKLGFPSAEFICEIEALKTMQGENIVELIRENADDGVMLLDRIKPGLELTELSRSQIETEGHDDRSTMIVCDIMQPVQKRLIDSNVFPHFKDWMRSAFSKYSHRYKDAGPVFLFEYAVSVYNELFGENDQDVLLHGDLHHYNILSSDESWKVIDPKGVIGPPILECGAYLRNPIDLMDNPNPYKIVSRRVAVMSNHFRYSKKSVCDAGIAVSVLSACWSLESNGTYWENTAACAELLRSIRG